MAKTPNHRTLDSRDADALDNLLDSRGWQLVDGRLRHELVVQVGHLKQPQDEQRTAYIRGMIAGLELAGAMPKRLLGESKKGRSVE